MTRRVLAVYAALAVLTVFLPVFSGQLPVPTDCGLRLLPGHAPVIGGNDELWDVPTAFLPWTRAVSDAYREGRLPLRLAANGCGTPLWANPQAQALTPTTWITWFLPEAWALPVAAAIRLFFAAAGAYLFLRRRKLSDLSAATAGFAYAFSLAFTAWMHYPLTYPQALFPWLCLAGERLAEGRAGGLLGATAVITALLLGGYPEGEFLAAVAAFAVFVATLIKHRRAKLGPPLRLIAATLLAFGVTAVIWLPQAGAILESERSARVERAWAPPALPKASELFRFPLYADTLAYWVVPEARGNPRDGDKFGPYSFAGRASGYAGILVLTFALAAFGWRRAPAAVALARVALIALTLYILWFPPLRLAVDLVPGLRFATQRVTSARALFLTVFLLVLLAAFQWDRLRRGEGRVAALRVAAVMLLSTLILTVLFLVAKNRPPAPPWRFVTFAWPVLLLGCAIVLLREPLTPLRKKLLTVLVLAGTGVDLLRIGMRFNPGTPRPEYFPMTPVVREIQTVSQRGRFASNTGALSGMAYMYALQDVGVQDPVAPARYVDALAAATGYDAPARPLGNVQRLDAPLLDFLNVRARLDGERVRAVATPEASFPDLLIGCKDEAALLQRLTWDSDLVRAALVVGPDETFSGSAEILAFEKPNPQQMWLRVRSDTPRVVVLPETDDGGWSAESDGQPLPTFLANGAFLAIRIPAGETRIFCRYLPSGFREGLAASAISALFASVLAIRTWMRRPRSSRPSARSTGRNSAGAGARRAQRDTDPPFLRPGDAE